MLAWIFDIDPSEICHALRLIFSLHSCKCFRYFRQTCYSDTIGIHSANCFSLSIRFHHISTKFVFSSKKGSKNSRHLELGENLNQDGAVQRYNIWQFEDKKFRSHLQDRFKKKSCRESKSFTEFHDQIFFFCAILKEASFSLQHGSRTLKKALIKKTLSACALCRNRYRLGVIIRRAEFDFQLDSLTHT